mmetsp:Transcript_70463/g.223235  ORF Transcript_70463/g.223235 Transcript_70463/m.223235 type:complete len:201 (-) Transcript_70463:60-662(-)
MPDHEGGSAGEGAAAGGRGANDGHVSFGPVPPDHAGHSHDVAGRQREGQPLAGFDAPVLRQVPGVARGHLGFEVVPESLHKHLPQDLLVHSLQDLGWLARPVVGPWDLFQGGLDARGLEELIRRSNQHQLLGRGRSTLGRNARVEALRRRLAHDVVEGSHGEWVHEPVADLSYHLVRPEGSERGEGQPGRVVGAHKGEGG